MDEEEIDILIQEHKANVAPTELRGREDLYYPSPLGPPLPWGPPPLRTYVITLGTMGPHPQPVGPQMSRVW